MEDSNVSEERIDSSVFREEEGGEVAAGPVGLFGEEEGEVAFGEEDQGKGAPRPIDLREEGAPAGEEEGGKVATGQEDQEGGANAAEAGKAEVPEGREGGRGGGGRDQHGQLLGPSGAPALQDSPAA